MRTSRFRESGSIVDRGQRVFRKVGRHENLPEFQFSCDRKRRVELVTYRFVPHYEDRAGSVAANALGGTTHQELAHGAPALGTYDDEISLPCFGLVNNLLIRRTDSHAAGTRDLRAV